MALRLNGADKFRCLLRPLDVLTVSSRERACACTQSDWPLQIGNRRSGKGLRTTLRAAAGLRLRETPWSHGAARRAASAGAKDLPWQRPQVRPARAQ